MLKDYLVQWLENSQSALRAKTVHQYRAVINKHIIPPIGDIQLRDLKLSKIERYYSDQIQDGVGIRTVRICHNILYKALDKAVRYNLVAYNPAHGAALPQYKHGEMQVLDETQVSHFLIAAQDSPYRALYHVAVTTGMRQGELFGLKWIDLQWESGVLHLQRQAQRVPGQNWKFVEPKTRSGRRTVKLGEGTLQVLREHKINQPVYKEKIGDK